MLIDVFTTKNMPIGTVTVILAMFLLITSPSIIILTYGQTKQITQLGGKEQTSTVKNGLKINDVRQSRLVLLQGIDNAILRLVHSKPGTNAGEFNTTHIAELLKTDQLDDAIVELTKLQAHVVPYQEQKSV